MSLTTHTYHCADCGVDVPVQEWLRRSWSVGRGLCGTCYHLHLLNLRSWLGLCVHAHTPSICAECRVLREEAAR